MTMQAESIIFRNDKGDLHRLDGPAWIYRDGSEFWYQNGALHRLDGPAIIHADGSKTWFQYGKCHRLDGPAHERPDGKMAWYINDENVTTEVEAWLEEQKITLPMSESELSFFIMSFVGPSS